MPPAVAQLDSCQPTQLAKISIETIAVAQLDSHQTTSRPGFRCVPPDRGYKGSDSSWLGYDQSGNKVYIYAFVF